MGFWKRMRTSNNYTHERMVQDHQDSTALFLAGYPEAVANVDVQEIEADEAAWEVDDG